MTPTEFRKLEALYDEAVALSEPDCQRFLDARCGENTEIREALQRMLDISGSEKGLLTGAVGSAWEAAAGSKGITPGERLGEYRVLGHLASGGMAHVYVAERADEAFQKKVAIKVIQNGLGTAGFESRFRQERQILASIDHPNCCHLLDGGVTMDGLPYLVMEYIDGESITAYVAARKLDLRSRLELFRQLCAAVEYAHSNLIVHRDIKPGNVLVTSTGVVKLMDFGIAKLLDGHIGGGDLTTGFDQPATPAYASPEQLRGSIVTTSADVYSMGVLLEELLTGKRRQPGVENAAGLPGELQAVLAKATHEEPGRRYQSAGQFSEDIGRYLDGYPVLAKPDSWAYRTSKFLRRNRVASAAVFVAVAALAGGLFFTAREQQRTQQRFNEVRSLATVFLFEFDNLIRDLNGSMEARRKLVERALTSLEALSRDAEGDPSLQTDIARAWRKVAAIQYLAGRPNLGDREGAIVSVRKEVAIREWMAQKWPSDFRNRVELAGAYGFISGALDGVDPKQARALEAKEGEILGEVVKEYPTHPGVLFQAGAYHARRGLTLHKEGKLQESLAAERQAIELLEKVRKAKPDNAENLRFLGWSYIYAGDVLGGGGSEVHLGDRPGAIQEMIKGREVFRDNLRLNPTNALAARDEIAASGRIAATYHMMGEYEKAIPIQQEVAKGFDDLLRKNPTSNESARDAANTHSTLGLTLAKAGRLEEAVQALRRSEQLHQERCVRFPQDIRGPLDLAVTLDQTAEVSVRQKNWGQAVEQLRKAIALRAAGLQKDANDQRLLWRQAKSYGRLGNALLETGDKGAARTALEQAQKAFEGLRTKSKLSSEDAKSLAEVTKRLAALR